MVGGQLCAELARRRSKHVISSHAPDLGPRFGQPNSWPICFRRILVAQAKLNPLLDSTSHWSTLASDKGLASSKTLIRKYSMYRHSKLGLINSCSLDQLNLPYMGTSGHGYVLQHVWNTSLCMPVLSEVHSKQTWWHWSKVCKKWNSWWPHELLPY